MPNVPKTPHRQVRVDDDLWDRFEDARQRAGAKDRSEVIRDFIRWYVHDQGAKMPKRPSTSEGYVELPPGISTFVDDVSPLRPKGRTWYRFTTVTPMNAGALALVDGAGGGIQSDSRQVWAQSLATVRRAYDALRAAGYQIEGAEDY